MGTRRVSSPHGEFTLFFTYKSPFSNFFKCNFKAKALDETSIDCICVEQFYMYNKAVSCGDHAVAKKVLQSDDPKEIKRLGAQLLGFDRTKWNKISEDVMKTALKAKFSRNEDLRELLFATHGSELVECSPMDQIWGIGLAIDDPEVLNPKLWKGENKLGKLMTKVREKLWSKRKFRNDRRKAEKLDTPEDAIKYFNIHCRYSPEPRLARSARPAYTSMSGAWNTSSVDRPTPSRRRRHSQSPTPSFDSKHPRILFRSEMSKKYRKESSPERRKDASPLKSVSSSITKMGFSRSSCRRSQSPLRGSHAEKVSRDSPGQSSATCSYSRRDFAPEESHYKKTEPGVKEKAAKAEKKEGTPTKTPEKSVDSHRSGRRRSPSPVKGSYARKTFDSSCRPSFETGPRSRRDSAPEAAHCKKAGEMEVKDEKASETSKKNDATVTEKSLDSHMSNRHRSTTPPSKCPINKSSRHSSSQNITTTTEKKEEKPKRESIKWPEDKLPRSFRFREVSNSDEDSVGPLS